MTNGAQDRPLERHGIAGFANVATDIAPLVSNAALAVLGFLWLVVLIKAFGFEPGSAIFCCLRREHFVHAGGLRRNPILGRPRRSARRQTDVFESINIWCAVLALLALAITGVATWQQVEGLGFWQRNALQVAQAVLGAASCTCRGRAWLRYSKTGAFETRGNSVPAFQPEVGANGGIRLCLRCRHRRSVPHRA